MRNSLPNWATWLDRAFIEREWQQWHNCHKTATHVQVEAFACKIYGGVLARAHCSIQTTAVLAESSIPATLLSKFKIKSLQTATLSLEGCFSSCERNNFVKLSGFEGLATYFQLVKIISWKCKHKKTVFEILKNVVQLFFKNRGRRTRIS